MDQGAPYCLYGDVVRRALLPAAIIHLSQLKPGRMPRARKIRRHGTSSVHYHDDRRSANDDFGRHIIVDQPAVLSIGWFKVKLVLTHRTVYLPRTVLALDRTPKARDRFPENTKWLRWFNEIPNDFSVRNCHPGGRQAVLIHYLRRRFSTWPGLSQIQLASVSATTWAAAERHQDKYVGPAHVTHARRLAA